MSEAINSLEELVQDYKEIFSSERGKRVLKDLERRCFVKSSTFSNESLEMAKREGQRIVFLHIDSMVNMDIEKMRKQIKEQK